MSFEQSWLLDPDSAPPDQIATASKLHSFLEDAGNMSEPDTELSKLPSDALSALVGELLTRKDGGRLSILRTAGLPKPIRKLIGKAIHKLKTSGVSCDAPQGRVGTISYRAQSLPSFMSQPLASGLHLVILSGPGLSCYAVLDRHGVEELVAIEDPSRTKLKRLIRSIEEQHDVDLEMRFIEADANLVRSRICEALERHQTTGKPLPTDHVRVRQLLEDGISSDPHPVRKAIGSVTAQLVQQSSDLLGTLNASQYSPGAVDRPVFDEAWQTEMGQRLQNAAASPVVVDDDQRRDRIHQEIDRMVVDWFGHEERTWEAQRLLDSAYVLHQTRRSASAAIAVATADALLDQTVEALDIPWARDSVRGIVHVDALIQMSEGHVHGPDCQHDHDEMSEPKTDPKSTLIVPGNQMSEGHVHGPDCQHGHDEMSEPKTDPDSKLIVPGN